MSREIKFRAWSNEHNRYCDFVTLDELGRWIGWIKSSGVYLTTVDIILEQYTGLKDKNGKEIYEGDIVKAKIDGFWQTGAHTVSEGKATWNLEVVYNDVRYMDVFHILGSKSQPNRIYYLFDEPISDIEVIGNVHENQELLGGKE